MYHVHILYLYMYQRECIYLYERAHTRSCGHSMCVHSTHTHVAVRDDTHIYTQAEAFSSHCYTSNRCLMLVLLLLLGML